MNFRIALVLVLVCLCFSPSSAALTTAPSTTGPRLSHPGDPQGDAVRTAAAEFLQCFVARNFDQAAKLFQGPPEQREIIKLLADHATAWAKLAEVSPGADDKEAWLVEFGHRHVQRWSDYADRCRNLKVLIAGDSARLAALDSLAPALTLERKTEGWVVISILPPDVDPDDVANRLRKIIAKLDETAAFVRANDTEAASKGWAEMRRLENRLIIDPGQRLPPPQVAPVIPPNSLNSIRLSEVIGLTDRSPEFASFLAKLPGLPVIYDHPQGIYISSLPSGLSVELDPNAGTVTSLHAYGPSRPGVAPFPGVLPHELTFGDTRGEIELRLGLPTALRPDGALVVAHYPQRGVELTFLGTNYRDPEAVLIDVKVTTPDPQAEPPARVPSFALRFIDDSPNPGPDAGERLPDPMWPNADPLVVTLPSLVSGADILSVQQGSNAQIEVTFTPEAAARLLKITGQSVGQRLAVVVDGKVILAPRISSAFGASVVITTWNDPEEAQSLIDHLSLAAFALPEPP